MEKVFKKRRYSKLLIGTIAGCSLIAFYCCYKEAVWPSILPLLPPLILVILHHRTRYIIHTDGQVEIRLGAGKNKFIDQIHRVIYRPKSRLDQRITLRYRQTFEKVDPDQPEVFIETLRQHYPELSVEIQ